MVKNEIISPYFENGIFAGVRVTLGDDDFVIAPKDFLNGKAIPWQVAMDVLKAEGLATWNYRQICLTMAYRKEVDKVLVDNGGDSLDNMYWTSAEYSAYNSFIYGGYDDILDYDDKNLPYGVRPIKNLKK